MNAAENGSPSGDPDGRDRVRAQPFLEVAGVGGSYLRATSSGLTLSSGGSGSTASAREQRTWPYDRLTALRVDSYGSIGVVKATIQASGGDLPLLLLEPEQITPARRALEVVWNLMAKFDGMRVLA
jgi:hypothetical protein